MQELINQGIEQLKILQQQWGMVFDLFLVVLAVVAFNFVLNLVLKHLERGVAATENTWDDAIYSSLNTPARTLAWVIGLSIAVRTASPSEGSLLAEFSEPVRTLALIAVFSWFLLRLIGQVKDNILVRAHRREEQIDETLVDALGKLLRAAIVITTVLVMLQSVGISVSGVLAFGGVGGIAVGFAAKDLLANLFGGVTIYLNRPFSVGDWIRSPDQDIEGIVEKIGWRFVTLRRFNKRALYVPNATFTTVSLENPSRMTNRCISETIGLRFDDAAVIPAIVADIHAALDADKAIDSNQVILVYFNSYGTYTLDIMVYCFTVTTRWAAYLEAKQNALLRCYEIIAEHGAEVAVPTTRLQAPVNVEMLTEQQTYTQAKHQGSNRGTDERTSSRPSHG